MNATLNPLRWAARPNISGSNIRFHPGTNPRLDETTRMFFNSGRSPEGTMSEASYIKLTGNFYFDPVKKHILKKQGGQFSFVLHDRRRSQRPVTKDRRAKFEAMPIHLKPIARGLFWDPESKNVYRKIGNNFVLYSKDRRKGRGPNPSAEERRK
jgi:hypothetical protein